MNEVTTRLKSIFFIILLGAIGSGFWDLFLKDFFEYVLNLLVVIADKIFIGYADSLYDDVGRGQTIHLLTITPIILISIIIIAPWIFTFRLFFPYVDEDKTLIETSTKAMKYISLIAAISILVLYGSVFFDSAYTLKTANYIEQSIEIIRPAIDDKKHILLRSKYRSIDTFDEFKSLYLELQEIANTADKKLPDFSPLLIDKPS